MADIATSLSSQTERQETGDATIMAVAGAGLLAIFLLMVVLLPFDAANTPDYLPTIFSP